jgi:sodium-independent sulfate anion transporter 11
MAAAGRIAAKVLGINLDYRKEEPVSGAASISSVETCRCIVPVATTPLIGS